MVKPDPDRDYYKDLGVEQTADITEIKKQYRKLALKFHPDRNQTNIEDATKQFQIIGEAHEILADPSTKQKYDIARAKKLQQNRARYPGASGVRGNPWQDVAEQYPVPPRRDNMPPPRARPTPNHHPTAREKYKNMFSGGSSTRTDDEGDAYSTFDTFNKYKQSRGRGGKGTPAGANPNANTNSNTGSSENARPPPPETPPRPAPQPRTDTQREKANAAFGSRRGRMGYQPASPAAADEPPVTRSSYFSTGRHTDLFANATANARRERDEAADKSHSAESMDEDSDSYLNRQRRQYSGSSGEKLDPGSAAGAADLGRSRSTREPKRTTDGPPSSRQRSASVPDVEEATGFAQAPNSQPGFNATTSGSAARLGTQVPHGASATAPGTAGPSTNSSSTASFNGGAPKGNSNLPSAQMNGQSPTAQNGNPSVYATLPYQFMSDTWSSYATPASSKYSASSLSPMESTQNELLRFIIDSRANGKAKAGTPSAPAEPKFQGNNSKGLSAELQETMHSPLFTDFNGTPRFSFNVDDDTFKSTSPQKHRFASTSAENVNTAFAGSEDYNFSANNSMGGVGAPKHRATSATRLGRRSPLKKSKSGLGPESIGRTYTMQDKADEPPANSASSSTSRFDPDEWTKKINPEIFSPPPGPQSSSSPTRGRSGTLKKSKKSTPLDGQGAAQNEGGFGSAAGARPTSGDGGSPMAMDIDSPPPDKTVPTSRNIPVEPSRPDWRPGTHGGKDLNGNAAGSAPGTPSKPAPTGTKANPITIAGSEDTDDLKASFADLRNTEPLHQPRATGLGEWGDMKSTLPFQSRPSTNINVDRPPIIKTKAPNMVAPRPPIAPAPLVSPHPLPGTTLRPEDWMGYMASFASYLEEYTRFDRRVIAYLSEIQQELDERDITGQGYGWLHPNRDDATVTAYEVVCRDAQDVREKWTAAGNTHRTAMREMRLIRERVRKVMTY